MKISENFRTKLKWAMALCTALSLVILAFAAVVILKLINDNDFNNPNRKFEIRVLRDPRIKDYSQMAVFINGNDKLYQRFSANNDSGYISIKLSDRDKLKPEGKIVSEIIAVDSTALQLHIRFYYGESKYSIFNIYPKISEGKMDDMILKLSRKIDSLGTEISTAKKLLIKIKIHNKIIAE